MRKSRMHLYWSKAFRAVLFASASLNAVSLFCQTAPTLATESGLTRIYITVSDKKSPPALSSELSLAVSIDKLPAQVMSLRYADNEKLVFAVLVDTSGSNFDHADAIRQAALESFQGLSFNNQEGYLITFDVNATTTSKPISANQAQKMLAAVKFYGGTALFGAIEATCESKLSRAANPSTPRRVILLLSDGDDNKSLVTLAQAENVAQKEGVSIFSLSTPSHDSHAGEHVLKQLTQATGGREILDKDLVRGAHSLLAAINAQWAVDIVTPTHTGPQLHPVAIKSSLRDAMIYAPSQVSLP